jgi:predicted alpha/beta-fold hydrolase
MRVIDRLRVPALIITAEDDPFVPSAPFRDPKIADNPWITLALCEHGGHCGFVGPASDGDDGYWAERRILDFVQDALGTHASTSAAPQSRQA